MPIVTIIIALFNKATYIEKCINSILNQSFRNWQLIVINDGSTDESLQKIVPFLRDERIKLITQPNGGPGKARNKGLEFANTKYVTFIDGDDYWNSEFLTTAISALENNNMCDVWICGTFWDPLGEFRSPFLKRDLNKNNIKWQLEENYSAEEVHDAVNLFTTGAVVSKTEIIKKYGGYFDKEKVTFGEDSYLWLQVMFNHLIYRERNSLLIVNTEGSELGIGRRSPKPIPPSLKYPKPIIKNCPNKYKPSLIAFLNLMAFYAFRREVFRGNIFSAIKLWGSYPKLSKYRNKEFFPLTIALFIYPIKYYIIKSCKAFIKL